jgi:cytochrome b561
MKGDHRPPGVGYGTVARLFHWVTALLVLAMIPVGIAMTSQGFDAVGDQLYIFHKGTGSVLLVLVVLRILWKVTHPEPPLPAGVPRIQRRIAGVTHWALLILLLVMTVSGYVRTVGEGFPIELLDFLGIPPLLSENVDLARRMSVLHAFSAYLLTALIAAHVGAAVHHALIARDGVMRRIWPPVRPAGGGAVAGAGEVDQEGRSQDRGPGGEGATP